MIWSILADYKNEKNLQYEYVICPESTPLIFWLDRQCFNMFYFLGTLLVIVSVTLSWWRLSICNVRMLLFAQSITANLTNCEYTAGGYYKKPCVENETVRIKLSFVIVGVLVLNIGLRLILIPRVKHWCSQWSHRNLQRLGRRHNHRQSVLFPSGTRDAIWSVNIIEKPCIDHCSLHVAIGALVTVRWYHSQCLSIFLCKQL